MDDRHVTHGRRTRRRLATALAVALATATSWAQDPWSDLGCAHPGASGEPALAGTGSLQAGESGALDLSAAAPNALAQLFAGLSPVSLAFKGGTLKAFPLFPIPAFMTDANGSVSLPFTWPLALPQGSELTFQYAIADAGASAGVALSNALLATAPLPIPTIDSFGPTAGGDGTVITLTGGGFTEGPEDYCAQVVSAGGQILGFSRATSTSGESLEMEIGAAISTAAQGSIMVAAGEGAEFVPSSIPPDVTVVGDVWLWSGDTSEAVTAPGTFQFTPPVGDDTPSDSCQKYLAFVNASGALQVNFPYDTEPCPPDTSFILWLDAGSSGGTVDFFDYWACLENDVPLSAVDCANKTCQVFQQAFFDYFGVFLACSTQVIGNEVQILVQPPVGESWDGAGALLVCADGLPPCTSTVGGLVGAGLELPVECPPNGGNAVLQIDAALSSTGAFSLVTNVSIPPGLDDAQCTTLYCAAIEDAILAETGALVTCIGVGDTVVVLPPFLDPWVSAFASAYTCPAP